MKSRLKRLLKEASLEEMKEALFFLLSQIYALMDEKEQQDFFLHMFKGEKGKVPSMVYY